MNYIVNARNNTIAVRGRVRAPRRAVYALVADESDARPGDYWTKTYVGKVAADGAFTGISAASALPLTLSTVQVNRIPSDVRRATDIASPPP